MDIRQAHLLLGSFVLVLGLPLVGVHNHRPVVGGDKVLVTSGLESFRNTLDLPWGGGTAGVPMLPRDIYFQLCLDVGREEFAHSCQVHSPAHVSHRCLRRSSHHRYHRATRAWLVAWNGSGCGLYPTGIKRCHSMAPGQDKINYLAIGLGSKPQSNKRLTIPTAGLG